MRSVRPRKLLLAVALVGASLAASGGTASAAGTPVLVSPATGTTIGSTFTLSYTLPQTPVANSVTVTFSGGPSSVTLLLSGAATSGSISIQTANPGAATGVQQALGSPS